MSEYFDLLFDSVVDIWSSIPSWFWSIFLFVFSFSLFVRVFRVLLDPYGFGFDWSWLRRKVTDLLCKSKHGFKIAYKLGWAERGVHFFDCGQDCHLCPRFADCDSELRKISNN